MLCIFTKLLKHLYIKLIYLLNEKYDCLHRLLFVIGAVSGGFFVYFLLAGNYLTAAALALAGGGLAELVHEYLESEPRVVLVAQANEEKDDEFLEKMKSKLNDTIRQQINEEEDK